MMLAGLLWLFQDSCFMKQNNRLENTDTEKPQQSTVWYT